MNNIKALMRQAGQDTTVTDVEIFELMRKSQTPAMRADQVVNMPDGTQFFIAEYDDRNRSIWQREVDREQALAAARWGSVVGFQPFRNAKGQAAPFGNPLSMWFERLPPAFADELEVDEPPDEPPVAPSDGKRHLDLEPVADVAQPKIITREIEL